MAEIHRTGIEPSGHWPPGQIERLYIEFNRVLDFVGTISAIISPSFTNSPMPLSAPSPPARPAWPVCSTCRCGYCSWRIDSPVWRCRPCPLAICVERLKLVALGLAYLFDVLLLHRVHFDAGDGKFLFAVGEFIIGADLLARAFWYCCVLCFQLRERNQAAVVHQFLATELLGADGEVIGSRNRFGAVGLHFQLQLAEFILQLV